MNKFKFSKDSPPQKHDPNDIDDFNIIVIKDTDLERQLKESGENVN